MKVDRPALIAIGNHPAVARAYARLIEQFGEEVIKNRPDRLYNVQENILAESLKYDRLTQLQADILSILSWVLRLEGGIVRQICCSDGGHSPQEFAEDLEDLMLGCLVEADGKNYALSPAPRTMFRRHHGFGRSELIESISRELEKRWASALNSVEDRRPDDIRS